MVMGIRRFLPLSFVRYNVFPVLVLQYRLPAVSQQRHVLQQRQVGAIEEVVQQVVHVVVDLRVVDHLAGHQQRAAAHRAAAVLDGGVEPQEQIEQA